MLSSEIRIQRTLTTELVVLKLPLCVQPFVPLVLLLTTQKVSRYFTNRRRAKIADMFNNLGMQRQIFTKVLCCRYHKSKIETLYMVVDLVKYILDMFQHDEEKTKFFIRCCLELLLVLAIRHKVAYLKLVRLWSIAHDRRDFRRHN